jgi:hypothetical protein
MPRQSTGNRRQDCLQWLEHWYAGNCNGYWEHSYGPTLCFTNELAWTVEIQLTETEEERKEFKQLRIENGKNDWLHCYRDNSSFIGCGDVFKLNRILSIFQCWAECESETRDVSQGVRQLSAMPEAHGGIASWFECWIATDWTGGQAEGEISVSTLDNPGWAVSVPLKTVMGGRHIANVHVDRGEHDWMDCLWEDSRFVGYGDPYKLSKILSTFRKLAVPKAR